MKNRTSMLRWGLIILVLILSGVSLFLQNKPVQTQTAKANPPSKLSEERYKQIKEDLLQIVAKEDPRNAVTVLKHKMDSDPAVLHSCHELLHEIGFASYKKYDDFGQTLVYKDDICVSGYTHGAIEGYFSEVKDISQAITICNDYPPDKFISWECFHGIGHGLMYYNGNNVPLALDGCKLYDTDFARSACSNGVYMENFNADADHPSEFLDPKNPYYPCNKIDQDKPDCYMNAPIYFLKVFNDDYDLAAQTCASVEEQYKHSCFYGLGSQITRRNMDNPKFVETFCETKSGDKDACMTGMVGWYISYYASLKEATALCDTLQKQNKSQCIATVEIFRSQF